MPTSIAGMTRLVIDLKAHEILLDEQHARLTIVLRDPADWSLAVEHLGRSMLREAGDGSRKGAGAVGGDCHGSGGGQAKWWASFSPFFFSCDLYCLMLV